MAKFAQYMSAAPPESPTWSPPLAIPTDKDASDIGEIHKAKGDEQVARFRLSKDFWLCLDDGLLGKHGDPTEVRVVLNGKSHRVWVEQRAKDKFGLVPTEEDGEYSNQFLGVDSDGKLTVSSSWGEHETWVVSAS